LEKARNIRSKNSKRPPIGRLFELIPVECQWVFLSRLRYIEHKIGRSYLVYHLGLLTRPWRQALDNEFQAARLTDAIWRPSCISTAW
jgi:hypothetical protein